MITGAMGERTILMVEDSEEDFFATARALKKTGFENLRLTRTENVPQALEFLLKHHQTSGEDTRMMPSLILLDLNLPGMDGRELLVRLKRDDRFREIPVIILTTSNNPRDIKYCYKNGANGYHLKSVGFEKYLESIRKMIDYWFGTVTLPSAVN